MSDKSLYTQLMLLNRAVFLQHREELVQLYLQAFTTGELAQYIPAESANETLNELSLMGSGVIALRNEKIVGAIYGLPLAYDIEFPAEQCPEIPIDNTIYVAELMVNSELRGQGLASGLIHTFLKNEKEKGNTDAVIRVWDRNEAALTLYKKQGFGEIAEIIQEKIQTDGTTIFSMKKIYLHKKLTI